MLFCCSHTSEVGHFYPSFVPVIVCVKCAVRFYSYVKYLFQCEMIINEILANTYGGIREVCKQTCVQSIEKQNEFCVQTGCGVHTSAYCKRAGSFSGVKRPGRDVDRPPPCSADIKSEWSYIRLLPLRAAIVWTGTTLPSFQSNSLKFPSI